MNPDRRTTIAAPLPDDEPDRIRAVRELSPASTTTNAGLDALVRLAAHLFDAPIAALTIIDDERQWFVSQIGLAVDQTTRAEAFCAHAILEPELPMVVPDTAHDAVFEGNALVTGEPHIRFYAGIPLRLTDDQPVGSLCIIDRKPREMTPPEMETLSLLAQVARSHLLLLQIGLSKQV